MHRSSAFDKNMIQWIAVHSCWKWNEYTENCVLYLTIWDDLCLVSIAKTLCTYCECLKSSSKTIISKMYVIKCSSTRGIGSFVLLASGTDDIIWLHIYSRLNHFTEKKTRGKKFGQNHPYQRWQWISEQFFSAPWMFLFTVLWVTHSSINNAMLLLDLFKMFNQTRVYFHEAKKKLKTVKM